MNDNGEDIKKLQKDIESLKKTSVVDDNDVPNIDQNNNDMSGLSYVIDLFVSIIVGGVIGYYIDKYFDTMPIFMILLLILGFVSGIISIYRKELK